MNNFRRSFDDIMPRQLRVHDICIHACMKVADSGTWREFQDLQVVSKKEFLRMTSTFVIIGILAESLLPQRIWRSNEIVHGHLSSTAYGRCRHLSLLRLWLFRQTLCLLGLWQCSASSPLAFPTSYPYSDDRDRGSAADAYSSSIKGGLRDRLSTRWPLSRDGDGDSIPTVTTSTSRRPN